jgi:radical SAM superfamily enzyme YgiQ (UPF0313 family)
MSNLKFLFIIPRYRKPGEYFPFPLGLAYVVTYMKREGFDVSLLNLSNHVGAVDRAITEAIKTIGADVVCTGGMSFHWTQLQTILKAAKSVKPGIITVTGGPVVTATPRLAFAGLATDIGVMGEGELTMAELARTLCDKGDLSQVKGIIYGNKKGEAVVTSPRPAIADLDSLPFPDYDAFDFDHWSRLDWALVSPELGGLYYDMDHGIKLAEIISSRSCPFSCTFCYHPLGKQYRQRSLDNVFEEIDLLVNKYGVKCLKIMDELFSTNRERVVEFAARIKKYDVKWMAQWRVERVDREILKILKDSNILYMGFGVESMSDTVLTSMKKKTTTGQVKAALKMMREERVNNGSNIILGDPAETWETFSESFKWWTSNPEYKIMMGFILAVPDSEIYRGAVKRKLITDEMEFIATEQIPVINLTRMTDREFNRMRRKVVAYNMFLKWLRPGEVVATKRINVGGARVRSFSVKCPNCGHENAYRQALFTKSLYFKAVCRDCFSWMKVRTKDAFPEEYNSVYGILRAFKDIAYAYTLDLREYPLFKVLLRVRDKLNSLFIDTYKRQTGS